MKVEEYNSLRSLLIKFKALTINLIEILEKDDFSSLKNIFELRENIIHEIDKIDVKSTIFKAICEEISLLPLQKKLTLLMNEKKAILKNEINNFEATKIANRNYNKGYSIDSLFFNKKI